ncbi:FRG domain-containing protein [Paenibacillus sp. LjRoot56]|uniref:FRG domain-containing protein n=1 Tax=Paenibacillus sp. LjRoot56 TaxID=3342333 RepID=UPI003ECF52ED
MTEVQIDDWFEFYKFINAFTAKTWIFRGQGSSNWNLTSSLFRELERAKDLYQNNGLEWQKKKNRYENELIRMFKSQAHLYFNLNPDNHLDFIKILQDSPNNEYIFNRLEWLSLMQHYGAPTRLLDWTFSPYIGLFFGVENTKEDFVLYALNIEYIKKKNIEVIGEKEELLEKLFAMKSTDYFVYPYEPQISNERIVRQQGLFLVPSSNYRTFDFLLSQYDINDGNCDTGEIVAYKFIFKSSMIIECIRNLRMMNIIPDSLFPGIEGFCRSFKLHLFDKASNLKRIY